MRWGIIVVVFAACGRVGFDPLGGVASDDAPGSGSGSGSAGSCNYAQCVSAGGTCINGVCVINVNGTGPVMCPAGETCTINCNTSGACNGGIDCSAAAHCTIDCKVGNTCSGSPFSCGGGGCETYCRAANTCNNVAYTCSTVSRCITDCCSTISTCNGLSGTTIQGVATCP